MSDDSFDLFWAEMIDAQRDLNQQRHHAVHQLHQQMQGERTVQIPPKLTVWEDTVLYYRMKGDKMNCTDKYALPDKDKCCALCRHKDSHSRCTVNGPPFMQVMASDSCSKFNETQESFVTRRDAINAEDKAKKEAEQAERIRLGNLLQGLWGDNMQFVRYKGQQNDLKRHVDWLVDQVAKVQKNNRFMMVMLFVSILLATIAFAMHGLECTDVHQVDVSVVEGDVPYSAPMLQPFSADTTFYLENVE